MLEWFLRDHVTLKTGVNSALMNIEFWITEINYILKQIRILKIIKIENHYFKMQ